LTAVKEVLGQADVQTLCHLVAQQKPGTAVEAAAKRDKQRFAKNLLQNKKAPG
jgi:hypothetical protein